MRAYQVVEVLRHTLKFPLCVPTVVQQARLGAEMLAEVRQHGIAHAEGREWARPDQAAQHERVQGGLIVRMPPRVAVEELLPAVQTLAELAPGGGEHAR